MKQKLIAVAVAGALGAPALALAQTSTVNVYGNLVLEYDYININKERSANRANPDLFQSPGSAIGFRGEEKLGGGLSAWFQCESSADVQDGSAGFCSRNSALGLKGGFGNVFLGTWDTPMKRNAINVGGRDTGIFGTAFLLWGRSTTVVDGASAGIFKRRQKNSINYDSPRVGGFQLSAATSTANNSSNTVSAAADDKRRIYSVAGNYRNGPLELVASYELHQDFYRTPAAGVATAADDEQAWALAGSYVIGPVKVGGLFTRQDFDSFSGAGARQSNHVLAWHLGAEWKVAGPHEVHFGYTQTGSMKGAPGFNAGGVRATAGADSGAKLFQVRYLNNLSKRTNVQLGVSYLDNDTNANYGLGGTPGANTGVLLGSEQLGVGMVVTHRF